MDDLESITSSLTDDSDDCFKAIKLMKIISDLTSIPKEPFVDTLTDDDIIELTTTLYEMCDDYLEEHILTMHEPNFHKNMCNHFTDFIYEEWFEAGLCDEKDEEQSQSDYKDTFKLITNIVDDYFDLNKEWNFIPKRFQKQVHRKIENARELTKKINNIRSIPQPTQRTQEWYQFRHNLITASNLGKIFGTEASLNSLIYEKCLPLKEEQREKGYTYVNTQSPLHWGQKYEPVSVMLYEKMYNTTVEDFGCIQHKKYSFIGASPDGINVEQTSPHYGRMLEIKNIVNREIDGNPSKNYWIQMQIQMETCDLDKCDFLETRFKEFENEDDIYKEEYKNKERGVILYFVERISIGLSLPVENEENEVTGYQLAQQYSGIPHYVYMPLSIELTKESVDNWIEETRTKLRRSWSLYTPIYWYLEEHSCVLVERNKQWFQAAIGDIEKTWQTIIHEREYGYEHRAAKKKIKPPGLEIVQHEDKESRTIVNLPTTGGICLVKLDHDEIQ